MLFVSHDSSLYGAQLSLLGLISRLDKDRVSSVVVTPNEGDLVGELERLGVPVHVSPLTRWVVSSNGVEANRFQVSWAALKGVSRRVRAVQNLIAQTNAELVYTNTVTCVDGAIAARKTGRPHIWHLREHIRGNQDLEALLPPALACRVVSRLSSQVICNSEALRDSYLFGIPRRKIEVVYNGIDLDKFSPQARVRESFRSEIDVANDAPLVGIVGSITPRKGHLVFVDAAEQILKQHPRAIFVLAGAGEAQFVRSVEQRIAAAGLGDAFRFLGWRPDVERILPALDVLVIASDQEAFGRTVIEGMACGVPVVATRSGGPEEIVVDAQTGYLVPVNDPVGMGAAVSAVLQDAGLATRLGGMGRQRAVEVFSLDAYASKLQSIMLRVAHSSERISTVNG